MPRGDKSKYTSEQKRKTVHTEESYRERTVSDKAAERGARTIVNATDSRFELHKGDSKMATVRKKLKAQDVQLRAAEIRRHWSPLEKLRRTGLPPDVPARLKQFILGASPAGWGHAMCRAAADASQGR